MAIALSNRTSSFTAREAGLVQTALAESERRGFSARLAFSPSPARRLQAFLRTFVGDPSKVSTFVYFFRVPLARRGRRGCDANERGLIDSSAYGDYRMYGIPYPKEIAMNQTKPALSTNAVTVLLTDDRTAFIDEVAAAMRRKTGRSISRSAMIRAITCCLAVLQGLARVSVGGRGPANGL